jgi:anti-sigma regulatory factor (Ser/Thr protein kinase)
MNAALAAPVFHHIGLLHDTPDGYAHGCNAFIQEGLNAGAPVLVAVPGHDTDVIRDMLGSDAEHVQFADMMIAGRNPARVIPWLLLDFADRNPGRRVWVVSQPVWPARSQLELTACARHDALLNTAFAGRDAAILCPYDTARLPGHAIGAAHRTHPLLADGTNTWDSPYYSDPIDAARMFDSPLPDPPESAHRYMINRPEDLRWLRQAVAAQAQAVNLPPVRGKRLMVAINELASNSLEHGGGRAVLSVWTEPGLLVCQIDDSGTFANPMAGRTPPPPGSSRGHGLLIVHELVDLVRINQRLDGTSVRIHINLDE